VGGDIHRSFSSKIMFKQLFHSGVDHGVGFLASANLVTAGLISFLDGLEPALKSLLLIGQLGVAVATMVYVVKRAKAIRTPRKYTRKIKAPVEPSISS
jgi:hypothetical protein